MKIIAVLLIVSVLFVSGCTTTQTGSMNDQTTEDPTMKPSTGDSMEKSGDSMEPKDNVIEIFMDSFVVFEDGPKPQFSVKDITVNKGDTVRLHINATSGTHDFKLDEFSVFSDTPTGEVTVVEFTADKAGEFIYYCNQPGHRANGHWGTLTVLDDVMMVDDLSLANNYYRYDPAAFDEARDAGKVIFLDFHANWCPTCKAEKPEIVAAFNELNYDDIVGFEVHYNDDETQSFDTDITRQYQVAYQHTKVILDSNGDVVTKDLQAYKKQDVIDKIEAARS